MDRAIEEDDNDNNSTVGASEQDSDVEAGWRDDEREGDLLAQETHPADCKLLLAYGDTVHQNDGRHLDGGIAEDVATQVLYDRLIDHPHGMYSPPKGGVGKRFIKMFAAKLAKVRERKTNSEQALIFPAVILR
jgi:hypothetical protein